MSYKKNIDGISNVLLIAGAINWGLVGLFNLDLVRAISMGNATLLLVLLVAVGVAGVWTLLRQLKLIK